MPDARLAETLVSLVAPPDRAAALAGDLLERVPRQGRMWFWISVVGAVAAIVWGQIRAHAWQLAVHTTLGWFGYMFVVLVLLVAGAIAVNGLWLAAYVLVDHTGISLAAGWLDPQVGPSPPRVITHGGEMVIVMVLAPYVSGWRVAGVWEERSVAFTGCSRELGCCC